MQRCSEVPSFEAPAKRSCGIPHRPSPWGMGKRVQRLAGMRPPASAPSSTGRTGGVSFGVGSEQWHWGPQWQVPCGFSPCASGALWPDGALRQQAGLPARAGSCEFLQLDPQPLPSTVGSCVAQQHEPTSRAPHGSLGVAITWIVHTLTTSHATARLRIDLVLVLNISMDGLEIPIGCSKPCCQLGVRKSRRILLSDCFLVKSNDGMPIARSVGGARQVSQ